MRKLFVSFTALLFRLADKKVTDADLATGLFHFGCCLEHVLNPGAFGDENNEVLWAFRNDPEGGKAAHAQIVAAVRKAQEEGRIVWRDPTNPRVSQYDLIAELLERNGLGPLGPSDYASGSSYSYASLAHRVRSGNLPLEVVR